MKISRFLDERISPIREKSFRLFLIVQFISYCGTWIQETSKSFWVLNNGGAASSLGVLVLMTGLAPLLFTMRAGRMVDRMGAARVAAWTQAILGISSIVLFVFSEMGILSFPLLLGFALFDGIIIAFDIPAISSIVPDLVRDEKLQQGLSLNSLVYNISRMLGPVLAALCVSVMDIPWLFLINGISFLCVAVVIYKKVPFRSSVSHEVHLEGSLKSYLKSAPPISMGLIRLALLMGLIYPISQTTLRSHFTHALHLDAHQFGIVLSCAGMGSLVGSFLFFLSGSWKILKFMTPGIFLVVISLAFTIKAQTLVGACLSMFLFSFAFFLATASITFSIRVLAKRTMRGRINALLGVCFQSAPPLFAFPIGWMSDRMGANSVIQIAVFVSLGILVVTKIADMYWMSRSSRGMLEEDVREQVG